MTNHKKIGLIELPSLRLYDSHGNKWMSGRDDYTPLSNKQVLISGLRDGGFDAQLFNLKKGDEIVEFGNIRWKGAELTKAYYGRKIEDLDHGACDCWGITVNMSMDREVACMVMRHLTAGEKPIVVGGSDAVANPEIYIRAGAAAVVLDKSGAVNCSVLDHVLGNPPRQELGKVMLADGSRPSAKIPVMSPEAWPLPSVELARECLGYAVYSSDTFKPAGSLVSDIGCEHHCDFCQTSSYKLGYHSMSREKILRWIEIQKTAGAKSVAMWADQFFGRLLRPGGRDEVLMIMKGIRELEMPLSWDNGMELRKLTLGHGVPGNNNTEPDKELIDALFKWDGRTGPCCCLYISAERPVFGRKNYRKLLPWQEHCRMVRAIVRTGIPYIHYGVVIGFPDENNDSLSSLEEAVYELRQEVMSINPSLIFTLAPLSLCPIPGTRQDVTLRKSGLVRFDDPFLWGFWTPSLDTHHLSYEEVSDWQMRLFKLNSDVDSAGKPALAQHSFSNRT